MSLCQKDYVDQISYHHFFNSDLDNTTIVLTSKNNAFKDSTPYELKQTSMKKFGNTA